MKKVLAIVLTVAMVLPIGITTAFAASKGIRNNYADLNNDGICDYSGFVDLDGDGICDNCPSECTRPHDGTGNKHGRRFGKYR